MPKHLCNLTERSHTVPATLSYEWMEKGCWIIIHVRHYTDFLALLALSGTVESKFS
jgi:hypothetical protein